MRKIRVFVSSPGDVKYERTLAITVFRQFNEEFGGLIQIEPFFWEDGVLKLHTDPQSQTPLTSEYDIVICLFWNRLGSLLDPGMFCRPNNGAPYRSGTEFELETALASYEALGKPAVYLFRRIDSTLVPTGHKDYQKIHTDFIQMEEYYTGLLGREFLRRSSNEYEKPWEFVKRLDAAMREYVRDKYSTEALGSIRHSARQPRHNPFRGLHSFDYGDAAFFYGRLSATLEVIEALKARANEQCAFLMIFGSSGLGKSSLVRAGVLPWLRKPGVVDQVRFWRHVALIPSQDKEGNLFRLLAGALLHDPRKGEPTVGMASFHAAQPVEIHALPELGDDYDAHGRPLDAATLETLLGHDPKQAAACVAKALQKIGSTLGAEERGAAPLLGRLVIFIDQFEEVFSRRQRDESSSGTTDLAEAEPVEVSAHSQCEQFLRTLEILARSGWVWIVATARSDFFAECERWVTLRDLKQGTGTYHLAPPTPDELGEMVRRPAATVGLDFEHNHNNGRWLDDILIHEAHGNVYALPLLEFTLTQLYTKTPLDEHVIRLKTYDGLGGVKGALATHAEACFADVFHPISIPDPLASEDKRTSEEKYGAPAIRCFESVARQLVMISSTKGEPPLRRFPLKKNLETNPKQAELTNRLIQGRLLVVIADLDGDNVSVIVAHEALLSCWPLLANWIEKHKQDIKVRDRVSVDAAEWNDAGREPGLLYTDALRLDNARRVLEEGFLDEADEDFIRASITETTQQQFAEELRVRSKNWQAGSAILVDAVGREKVLRAALEDPSKTTRCHAAEFMRHAPVAALRQKLVDLVISDPEDRVRRAAAESLVHLGDEELFDEMFGRLGDAGLDLGKGFPIVGGVARVQIAAETSEGSMDLTTRIAGVSPVQRFRIWLRIRSVRFVRALPAFVLILIPQLFLAAVSAGFVKMVLGIGSYAVAQGDRSAGMGLFHGMVAAFFWGSFITFGISLHRFVFSRRRDRFALTAFVPLKAYFRPRGSLVFGGVAGVLGSYLIVFLIASVFSSQSLFTMGWVTAPYAKSSPDYTQLLWQDLNHVTGYRWPYLFTGGFLGIGMAMMANGLQASSRWWQESHAEEKKLVDWRQVIRLFWRTTIRALAFGWPIPLTLTIGWALAFTTMWVCFPTPLPAYTWPEKFGWGFQQDPSAFEVKKKEIVAAWHKPGEAIDEADLQHRAEGAVFQDTLRQWKISPWGLGLGILGDEIAQGVGGFFCIVGLGLGLTALARGINIEPSEE